MSVFPVVSGLCFEKRGATRGGVLRATSNREEYPGVAPVSLGLGASFGSSELGVTFSVLESSCYISDGQARTVCRGTSGSVHWTGPMAWADAPLGKFQGALWAWSPKH